MMMMVTLLEACERLLCTINPLISQPVALLVAKTVELWVMTSGQTIALMKANSAMRQRVNV
jgi:hypothetical protein